MTLHIVLLLLSEQGRLFQHPNRGTTQELDEPRICTEISRFLTLKNPRGPGGGGLRRKCATSPSLATGLTNGKKPGNCMVGVMFQTNTPTARHWRIVESSKSTFPVFLSQNLQLAFGLRPYHAESTGSRPITEVKPRRAWLVLGWATALEPQVL